MRRFAAVAALASTFGLALPAQAKPADLSPEAMAAHLAEVGAWRFAARKAGPDGKPECVETWRFAADGTGSIQSGEQTVTLTWRTAQGRNTERWLHITDLASTAGKDCMGIEAVPAEYPHKEGGFVVMWFNSGGALTCHPARPARGPNGETSYFLGDDACFGTLNPAREG